jgi:hypothetical protein
MGTEGLQYAVKWEPLHFVKFFDNVSDSLVDPVKKTLLMLY